MQSVVNNFQKKIDSLQDVVKEKDNDIARVLERLSQVQEQNLVLQEMLSKTTTGGDVKNFDIESVHSSTHNCTHTSRMHAALCTS